MKNTKIHMLRRSVWAATTSPNAVTLIYSTFLDPSSSLAIVVLTTWY
jgi:hypothetical protein